MIIQKPAVVVISASKSKNCILQVIADTLGPKMPPSLRPHKTSQDIARHSGVFPKVAEDLRRCGMLSQSLRLCLLWLRETADCGLVEQELSSDFYA